MSQILSEIVSQAVSEIVSKVVSLKAVPNRSKIDVIREKPILGKSILASNVGY